MPENLRLVSDDRAVVFKPKLLEDALICFRSNRLFLLQWRELEPIWDLLLALSQDGAQEVPQQHPLFLTIDPTLEPQNPEVES